MSKTSNPKTKFCIQWETQPKFAIKGLCSLMEHQSLVDIAICCGNNTLHAHKCVLAASSPLFKEAFEQNSCIEQVVISGCDFSVVKAIIEMMYCGETTINGDYLKYLIAASKLFQMKSLEKLFLDQTNGVVEDENICLPAPQFLTKKVKYPTAYNPLSQLKSNYLSFNSKRLKRKYVSGDAEKACLQEAQASRMALATLQKEIANSSQSSPFLIEDTCTEMTVENFIPHENQNLIQFSLQNNGQKMQGLMQEKVKSMLGCDLSSNVEILYKTKEGVFDAVTDDVLEAWTKGGLQYQVVDEHGRVGEVRELQVFGDKGEDGKIELQDFGEDYLGVNESFFELEKTEQNAVTKNFCPDMFFTDSTNEEKIKE